MADLKDINQRFYKEVFENRNVDAVDDFLLENAIEHEQPPPGVEMKPGREGIKNFLKAYLDAFDSIAVEIHAQYQEGDTVVTRASFTATHTGTFGGIPATGKTSTIEGIDIVRFEGDKMAEHWGQLDIAGLLMQLGVMPPM